MSEKNNQGNCADIFSLLGLLFIGLKLCGVISWSWWLVTAPFWGVFALIGVLLLIVLVSEIIKSASK